MSSSNLSETIHNKWLQASRKRSTNLYIATCDDWIWAFMQMMNYQVYLNNGLFSNHLKPFWQDLKLKKVVASLDEKRIQIPYQCAQCWRGLYTHSTFGRGGSVWFNKAKAQRTYWAQKWFSLLWQGQFLTSPSTN